MSKTLFYTVSKYTNWVKTSWTYSSCVFWGRSFIAAPDPNPLNPQLQLDWIRIHLSTAIIKLQNRYHTHLTFFWNKNYFLMWLCYIFPYFFFKTKFNLCMYAPKSLVNIYEVSRYKETFWSVEISVQNSISDYSQG